jgi:branched-chain amino acid transport system permease protein
MNLWQALADGILTGAIIALGAIGVTLSMTILRFANFAHAELITWGAYLALIFVTWFGAFGQAIDPFSFGWALVIAVIPAGLLTVALALACDRLTFHRLQRAGASRITLIFASFGLGLILRSLVQMIFGPDPEYYTRELQIAVLVFGTVRIMPDQMLILATAFALVVLLHLFLRHTRLGLALRATAESPNLALVNGIDVERMLAWTWALSAGLAAMAGVFFGLTAQLRPEMGFNLLLSLFAAAILGGSGSLIGAVVGGLLVGLAENVSVLFISPGYKPAIPFVLMVAMLYFRPTGLFGEKR